MSKKFEAILSGSGAFIMNRSDYDNDSNIDQPHNQIISDDNVTNNIFENEVEQANQGNQPLKKKTRN